MEVVGLVVAVVVAVGGWIASGVLSRREARRHLKVEFLISAYRRLDGASNRPMPRVNDEDIETAVSDVQLFGSPATIRLADEFARQFARHQAAPTKPMLEALRQELRSELQLDEVPPRDVWLRLDRTVDWSTEAAAVRQHLGGVTPSLPSPSTPTSDEWEVIDSEMRRIVDRLVHLVGAPNEGAQVVDLAQEAARQGLVAAETVRAIEGVSVMRDLAEGKPVSRSQAQEFATLVNAVLYTIEAAGPTDVN